MGIGHIHNKKEDSSPILKTRSKKSRTKIVELKSPFYIKLESIEPTSGDFKYELEFLELVKEVVSYFLGDTSILSKLRRRNRKIRRLKEEI